MSLNHLVRRMGLLGMLVAVLAALLPAQAGFAQGNTLSTSRSPSAPINISPAAVRDTLWIAHAMQRLGGPAGYEVAAYVLVLENMYGENPALDPAMAAQAIHTLRNVYYASGRADSSHLTRTPNESILALLAALSTTPNATAPWTGAVVAAAQRAYALTLGQTLTSIPYGLDRVMAAGEMHPTLAVPDGAVRAILRDALALSKQNTRFGQAFDQLSNKGWYIVSIYATTPVILQNSATLQGLPAITGLIDSTGAIHTTVGSVQTLVQDQFNAVDGVAQDAQALVEDLDKDQSSLVAYANDSTKQAQDQAKAQTQTDDFDAKLDKAKSAIEVLSALAGASDEQFGKDVEVVGKAAIEIAKAIDDYAKAVAGLSAMQALTSVSTAVLTGNIIGAVMSLMPLFVDQGPSPDQIMLDQIGALRQQVADLSAQMNSRFDRIDKSLNTIYTKLNDRFNQIDLQLGQLKDTLLNIQTTLMELQKRLNMFERNMYDILSDLGRRPLLDTINGKIGYRERTGATMPYQPDYTDAENTFQTYATVHAFDSVAIGGSARAYDDDSVHAELNKYPLDANLNYLATFVNQRWGLPSFASGTLANPREWAISARAWTELELDWPAYAYQIAPSRGTAVAGVGTELQTALRRISTVTTANGPQGNYQLFDKLVTNYKDKATGFDQAIQAVETTFLSDLKQSKGRTGTIDLWGGTNQPLASADLPNISSMSICGTAESPLSTPSNVVSLTLVAPYLVAYYLGLGTPSVCYRAEFVQTQEDYNAKSDTETYYGYLKIEVTSQWSGNALRTFYLNEAEQITGQCTGSDCWSYDPYQRAAFDWTGNGAKAAFEASATQSFEDTALPASVTSQVDQSLRQEQQNLYQKVLDGFAGGPVFNAARQLSGAKALVDALVTLGLPRALETDEYFRSFLHGSQRLLDQDAEQRLSELYTAAKSALPDHNVRSDIKATMDQRIDALKGVIWSYLAQIDAHTYTESQRLIATTLDRLTIANALVRTRLSQRTPGSVNFGRQMVSTTSISRTVTISNRGAGAPLTLGSIGITGTNALDFTRSLNCPISPATLAPGASCTVTLTFKPAATGNRAATLSIADNASGSPHAVALSGTGWLPAPARNLLANPGFELDANNDTRPDSWTIDAHVTRSGTVERSGSYAMQHTSAADASYTISSTPIFNLVPGTPYAFSGWVNIPNPSTTDANGFIFRLEVQWRDASNAPIATSPIKTYTAATGGAWNLAAATTIAPVGTVSAVVRMVAYSLHQTVYVDDVFFGNLLANPGFELDLNNDGRPDSWTSDVRVTRSSTVKRNGSYAMRHFATDNSGYTTAQVVAGIVPGTTYTFGGWVNILTTADAFTFQIDVVWRDGSNAVIGTSAIKTYTAHTGSAWNLASTSVQAPAGAASAVMRMAVTSLNATIYVDSLTLRP
jgi:hypothetical protein